MKKDKMMGVNFTKEYKILGFSKTQITAGKKLSICDKNVKFEVENFEHLRSNATVN